MKIKLRYSSLIILFASTILYGQNWQYYGSPPGGTIYALAVDSDGNIIAAPERGGIYVSTDNGNLWERRSTLIENTTVYSIAQNIDGKIFIGTYGKGLLSTTDLGINWTRISALNSDYVYSVRTNSDGDIIVSTYNAIYSSTDQGNSWTYLRSSQNAELELDNNGDILVTSADSIFISSDNGISWENISGNLPPNNIHNLIVTQNNNYFFVRMISGLYRSTDMGSYWEEHDNGLDPISILSLYSSPAGYIFAGTFEGLFYSPDYGNTWTSMMISASSNIWVYSIITDPSGNIFTGTFGGGIFFSSDNGINWIPRNNGLKSALVRDLLLEDEYFYCIAYGAGLFRSTDEGLSWENINGSINNVYFNSIFRSGTGLMFTGANNKIYTSTDNGDTWIFSADFPANSFTENSAGYIFVAAMGFGIYRTTNSGMSWENINNGITYQSIMQIEINSEDEVYALYPDLFYKSTDNGDSWNLISTGLAGEFRSFAIDHADDIYLGGTTGVFKSTDRGTNWEKISGLTSITELTVTPDRFFAIKYDSVFYSINGGIDWNTLGTGTEGFHPATLKISSDQFAYLGTEGSGIYKYDLSQLPLEINSSSDKIPDDYTLAQNYPNPFNPSTTIEYSVPEGNIVKIEMFDALGSLVKVLMNQYKQKGNYSITLDASDLPSGVYFYKLTAGKAMLVKKAVLIK